MTIKQTLKRKTKILATLGPASNSPDMIKKLHKAGVNVFRLNFSHGSHEDHRKSVETIRALEKKTGAVIGILADMQGPKLRIGTFKDGRITLRKGMLIRFDLDETPGDQSRVALPHPEILSVLKKGSHIYLDDGKVRAEIIKKGKDYVDAKILSGTKLSNRKGVNVPDVVIPIPALTKKDRKDLRAALDMGVDWIAQSFVQTPEDVKEAKKLIKGKAALMVKIEKPSAIEHFEEILEHADGVMIARGDLGVEIAPERVPVIQKRIVRITREQSKPVVVATQMLESMIENPRPTRAEASDVATAVYDGTDAVMLSAETAAGHYPEASVEIMNRICLSIEQAESYRTLIEANPIEESGSVSAAITSSACSVAREVNAAAIVIYTVTGTTPRKTVRRRPHVPVICITPDVDSARRLTVSYGTHPIHAPETIEDFTGPAQRASELILEHEYAKPGAYFVMTAGVPFGKAGTTNILRVALVEKP